MIQLYQFFSKLVGYNKIPSKFISALIKRKVLFIIIVALINGGFYTFYIPPWQKPDEPGHFEFAWLIANHKKLPKVGDFDYSVRKEIVASMIENDFFNNNLQPSNLLSISTPQSIVHSQVNDRPLYYMLVSIPLSFLKSLDLTFQLYIARLVSLILLVGTLFISVKLTEITLGKQHILSLVIPLSLSLHPSFVDIMTAVNDDVGATFTFSLFLLFCGQILKNGLSIKLFLLSIVTVILCYYTKNTVIVSVPIFLVTIALSKINNTKNTIVKISSALIAISFVFGFLFVRWGDARNWLRTSQTVQSTPTSIFYPNAPNGSRVLELSVSSNQRAPKLIQFINLRSDSDNSVFTIGAYIWSNQQNLEITPFRIFTKEKTIEIQNIEINDNVLFYYQSFPLRGNQNIKLEINPINKRAEKNIVIYYDNIILIEGELPNNLHQNLDNFEKDQIWDEIMKINQVDNSSFEKTGPYFDVKFSTTIRNYTRGLYPPNLILSSLFDLENSGWYYKSTIRQLTSTFWAKFGWGHVTLTKFPFPRPYSILGIFTLTGIIGFLPHLVYKRQKLSYDKKIITVFILSAFAIWTMSFFRGITSLEGDVFIPGARYAFPAIIPTMTILHMGWYFPFMRINKTQANHIYLLIITSWFIILFTSSMLSIVNFYN